MTTLAAIFGGVGAILLLVGLVGGGFEFSGSVMPKVGKVSRVLCFTSGGVLLLTALVLVIGETVPPQPQVEPVVVTAAPQPPAPQPPAVDPPTAPAVGYVIAGTGGSAYVFELPTASSRVLTEVWDGAQVTITCTVQGESVTSPINGFTSSLWNYTSDGGFIPDVMVDTGTFQPTMANCLA